MFFYIYQLIKSKINILKIIENLGWLVLDKIIRLIVGVWLARYLGPADFGLPNYALTFVTLFSAFAGLGLENIVVKDLINEHTSKEETLGTAALLYFLRGITAYILIIIYIFWLDTTDISIKLLVSILGSIYFIKTSEVALCWFESQVMSNSTPL